MIHTLEFSYLYLYLKLTVYSVNLAIQTNNNGENGQQLQIPTTMGQVSQLQQAPQQAMVWESGGMAPPDPNMMMMMDGQMQYFPGQPMMVPDPNFFQPNWNPAMGAPRPMFDQNWGVRPPWRGERPMIPPQGRNGGYLESVSLSILMIFSNKCKTTSQILCIYRNQFSTRSCWIGAGNYDLNSMTVIVNVVAVSFKVPSCLCLHPVAQANARKTTVGCTIAWAPVCLILVSAYLSLGFDWA